MKKFILRYLIIAISLITIYSDINFITTYINDYQTKITLYFLNLFLEDNISGIYIQINDFYRIVINAECNGFIPIIILISAILAYKTTIYHKLKWIVLSYVIYTFLNIFRILIIAEVAFEYGRPSFFWSHDIFGNILLLLTGLIIFNIYSKKGDF